MDEMLKYRNPDGIIQVYFDHSRPRIGECCIWVDRYSLITHGLS
jgi:hypothetical protein